MRIASVSERLGLRLAERVCARSERLELKRQSLALILISLLPAPRNPSAQVTVTSVRCSAAGLYVWPMPPVNGEL